MASLLHVKGRSNILGRDFFYSPSKLHTASSSHITIKASRDGGLSFPEANQVMLDEAFGWGYSCLPMIARETVGILYESSVAHMTFQAVKLTDLIKPSARVKKVKIILSNHKK